MAISYSGKNKRTVNQLKVVYFNHPDWIPCNVSIMPATWMKYRERVEAIVLRHPRLFPGYRQGDHDFDSFSNPLYELGQHRDCWGVLWNNIERGLDSYVEQRPLANWDAFDAWPRPDPLRDNTFEPRDWHAVAEGMQRARELGNLVGGGGLMHGFFYMRLFYLRGFENLMLDLATADPRLEQLIAVIRDYNVAVVQKYLALGAEYMSFGEDLGMQAALPMSPAMWRRWIKPTYEAMFGPCRDRGIPVYLHSDGHILEIVPDLIETGVRIINPQIRANGLAGLQRVAKGKVAIHVDLDRQLFPFATPDEIRRHIREIVGGLYMPEGGLMVHAECEPDVPLENIETICQTVEEVCNPPTEIT
jgi:uroporphyrinogen decarboxylase